MANLSTHRTKLLFEETLTDAEKADFRDDVGALPAPLILTAVPTGANVATAIGQLAKVQAAPGQPVTWYKALTVGVGTTTWQLEAAGGGSPPTTSATNLTTGTLAPALIADGSLSIAKTNGLQSALDGAGGMPLPLILDRAPVSGSLRQVLFQSKAMQTADTTDFRFLWERAAINGKPRFTTGGTDTPSTSGQWLDCSYNGTKWTVLLYTDGIITTTFTANAGTQALPWEAVWGAPVSILGVRGYPELDTAAAIGQLAKVTDGDVVTWYKALTTGVGTTTWQLEAAGGGSPPTTSATDLTTGTLAPARIDDGSLSIAKTTGLAKALALNDPAFETVAFLGDSISSGISGQPTDSAQSVQNWMWPIFAKNGQRITPVTQGTYPPETFSPPNNFSVIFKKGNNFQQGGMVTANVASVWLPKVIEAAPDVCFIMTGTNDLGAAVAMNADLSVGAEWIWDQVEDIIDALVAAGIKPVVCTLLPDAFAIVGGTPAAGQKNISYRQMKARFNDLLRQRVKAKRGILCDWWHVIAVDPANPLSAAKPGYLDADTTINPVHPGYGGGWALGHFAAGVVASELLPTGRFKLPSPSNALWRTPNPGLTGDVAGLPTSFSVTASTGVTYTATKNVDGSLRLVIVDTNPIGSTNYFRLRCYVSVVNTSMDGKTYQGVWDIRPKEAGFGFWNMSSKLDLGGSSPVVARYSESPTIANSNLVGVCTEIMPWSPRFLLCPLPVTHPGSGGTRQITCDFSVRGSGTIDIYLAGAYEVTP